MNVSEFIVQVVSDGIAGVKEDYKDDEPMRNGAVDGFTYCIGKSPKDIITQFRVKNREAENLIEPDMNIARYWYLRSYALELEWVLNCLSAATKTPLVVVVAHMQGSYEGGGGVGREWGT